MRKNKLQEMYKPNMERSTQMSRLIDADKLHSEFMKMAEFKPNSEIGEPTCGCTRRLVFHISEGIRKINEQPTVDAEPIVRCKDCIWWCECKTKDKFPYKKDSCNKFGAKMNADDFCSKGEER